MKNHVVPLIAFLLISLWAVSSYPLPALSVEEQPAGGEEEFLPEEEYLPGEEGLYEELMEPAEDEGAEQDPGEDELPMEEGQYLESDGMPGVQEGEEAIEFEPEGDEGEYVEDHPPGSFDEGEHLEEEYAPGMEEIIPQEEELILDEGEFFDEEPAQEQ